ncbi:MAG: SapC family protein [Glaciimonas sp.]|nr:SapC family protein [Glaciimonas sp.]
MPLEALSSTTHRHLRHQNPPQPFAFARQKALATLVAAEVTVALRWMPVVFGLNEGRASLLGLMGLSSDENLFINQQGQWRGSYIPAVFRAVPFGIAALSDSGEQTVIIDPDGGYFSEKSGTPLFDEAGQTTEFLRKILDFLKSVQDNQAATDHALQAILKADLLVPWDLVLTMPDGQPRTLSGLYRIDAARFDALDAAAVAALHQSGALTLIYGHLFSLSNVASLEKLAREREPAPVLSNIEFGILQDDYLKF